MMLFLMETRSARIGDLERRGCDSMILGNTGRESKGLCCQGAGRQVGCRTLAGDVAVEGDTDVIHAQSGS